MVKCDVHLGGYRRRGHAAQKSSSAPVLAVLEGDLAVRMRARTLRSKRQGQTNH